MRESKEYRRMVEISKELPCKSESVTEFNRLYNSMLSNYRFSNIDHLNVEVRQDIAYLEGMEEGDLLDQKFRAASSVAITSLNKYYLDQ